MYPKPKLGRRAAPLPNFTKTIALKIKLLLVRSNAFIFLEFNVTGILSPRFSKREEGAEIYSCKFSADEDYLACGLSNSNINLFSMRTNTLVTTLESSLQVKVPVTCVAFRPDHSTFKTKNVMASSCKNSWYLIFYRCRR
jgi:WD40 repeat protein